MYCRNCGNEVNEKAIGCPKCGLDPRTEKNFCPGCGTATNEKQVICISCGVSLAINNTTSGRNSEGGQSTGDDKTVAVVSYFTLLGFIIALIMNGNNKSKLGAYHLRQSLGLYIFGFVSYICYVIIIVGLVGLIFNDPFTAYRYVWIAPLLGGALGVFVFVLFVIGIINAASGRENPLPVIGRISERMFGNMFN